MGELKLKESTPLLIKLIGSYDDLRDYNILHSLGLCASRGDNNVISRVEKLAKSKSDMVKRMAKEVLLALYPEDKKNKLKSGEFDSLPKEIKQNWDKSVDQLVSIVKSNLNSKKPKTFSILYTLYVVNSEKARAVLREILLNCKMAPNYFRQIRYIYKISEFRVDPEFFGLVLYRFSMEKSYCTKSYWDSYQLRDSWDYFGEEEAEKEFKKDNSKLAYSDGTRLYFKKRVWRFLRKLG